MSRFMVRVEGVWLRHIVGRRLAIKKDKSFFIDSSPTTIVPYGSSDAQCITSISNPLVRVEGVGPSSLAWEANIIAAIRYPRLV